LFRKGIEKYRVGLIMLNDGHDPIEVKEKLKYATELVYKGKKYSWPESNITIKGNIPESKFGK